MTMEGYSDLASIGTMLLTTPNSQPRVLTKTTTFTGASGLGLHGTGTTIATLAGGQVEIIRISGRVTTNLTGASGTLTLGVTGSLALFIGSTVATTLLTTAANWVSSTATAGGLVYPALCKDVLINASVIMQSADGAADVTGGVMEINIIWRPATPGATLT